MSADVLEGVRVVEVSMWAFVPSAGAVLADWGADVIKVLPPEVRDPMQGRGVVADLPPPRVDVSFMWELMNRGKRCVALDLKTDGGREILYELVSRADVFITNLLPDARARFGVDVDDIRAIKPDIVYGRGTGQGASGPEADRGAFDATAFWARSGIGHMASQFADEFVPLISPAFGDTATGFMLAAGVTAALVRRGRTGEGATVDTSLLAAGMYLAGPTIVGSDVFDVDAIPRARHAQLPNPLMGAYKTADGRFVMLGSLRTDVDWTVICDALRAPELVGDERFVSSEARSEHRVECIEALDRLFATRTLTEWIAILADYPAPWCVVQTPREAGRDPQAVANGYLASVVTTKGEIRLVTSPVQFDEKPIALRRAPDHGEHTDDVLRELGFDDEQIIQFKLDDAVL